MENGWMQGLNPFSTKLAPAPRSPFAGNLTLPEKG
jgi:hypothetical protein